MKEFFENLKEARIRKGIRLEDIAERTRLPLKYLQAIEEGRIEELPPGYNRIFFKRYLKEIGEDTEEIWRDFNLFFGAPEETTSQAPETQEETPSHEEPPPEPPTAPPPGNFKGNINLDKSNRNFWVCGSVQIIGIVGYFD